MGVIRRTDTLFFSCIQIIVVVVLGYFFSSLFEKSWIKNSIFGLISVSVVLEIFSLYSLGKFAGYEFYFHFNLDTLKEARFQFFWLILFGLVAASGLFLVLRYVASRHVIWNKFYNLLASVLLLILLCLPGGVLGETIGLIKILSAKDQNIHAALETLGVSPLEYVFPDEVVARPGKNLVVISLESIERGFLGKAFPGLMPNLNRLKQKWLFFKNLNGNLGGSWTAGSLYCHQVGVPAFFKGQGNALFQGTESVKLTGLGHILKRAGYETRYLIGDADFAGVGDILRAYGIPVVSSGATIGRYPKAPWGMYDYDLFREAKRQIEQMGDKPFALFLSTVDSHFPNGIYDSRMKGFVPHQASQLEFSVASADYLVGDFLAFLKKKGLLERTTVFIFPDHGMMGEGGSVHHKLNSEERKLYLLTNSTSPKLQARKDQELYQIDLPRLIVDGAGIKTNAKFLADYLSRDDVPGFIKKHEQDISTLNNASVAREDYLGGFRVSAEQNRLLLSSESASETIALPTGSAPFLLDLTFNEGMVFIESALFRDGHLFSPDKSDYTYWRPHLIIKINRGVVESAYFGDRLRNGVYKAGPQVTFDRGEVSRIIAKNYGGRADTATSPDRVRQYAKDRRRFIAHAGGKIDGKIYTDSLEALDKSYEKGFRLFELDIIKTSDGSYVAAHDWQHWAKITGYQGTLPPSRAVFLNQKIYGEFTPLDLTRINEWFSAHPDAVLVTDKVNSPLDFAPKFVDPKRLMMELFSWSAVQEGQRAGIKSAMPTLALLSQLRGDPVQALKKMGVTDVSGTRRALRPNLQFFKDLKANGINVYLFHVNFDKGIDESYVVCHELDYAFGMYADSWDFGGKVDCAQ